MPRLRPLPAERQAALWSSLHAYIRNNGPAWITSVPNAFPATMECKADNDLPELLKAKGWIVSNGGTNEVFLPETVEYTQMGGRTATKVAVDRLIQTTVLLWTIDLPR
jgi:hypothetical protein